MCSDRPDSPTSDRPLSAIRVLHLVSTFQIKTDTNWLLQLIGRWPRDRFQPAMACMYGGGEMMARFADLGIPTFNLDAPREVSPAGVVRLCGLLRSLAPHILHTHLLRADLYGGLAGRLMSVPVILSSVYAIGAYRRARVRRLDRVLDWLCRLLATDALAVSQAVRDDLVASRGWSPDRVWVIHTGMAFSDQPPEAAARARCRAAWGLADHTPLVLTVARLSFEKGIDVLISAARIVRQRVQGVRFVVLGDGPLRETLLAQVRAAGLEGVVELPGFRPDVAAVLPGADLFVLPSLMEGMPNAVLEAYNAGLPLVVTSAGGLPEVVEHEQTGLVVTPGDAAALAEAILRLLEDQPLRRRLADRGRASARERFAVQRVAEQYAALYQQLYRTRAATTAGRLKRRSLNEPVAHT